MAQTIIRTNKYTREQMKLHDKWINKLPVLISALLLCSNLLSQDLSAKANAFLQSLSPELRESALFSLEDEERFNWFFIPIVRKGPTFNDFNEAQTEAALDLLRASLSQQAYDKTREIMELEKVLKLIENDNHTLSDGNPWRDPLNYHFCIFGTPAKDGYWGWRFEGHHISLNFTSGNGGLVSATPTFLGTNPGVVKVELQHGKEVLKKESELGFALLHSLSPDQLKHARFSEKAPYEIFTGNERQVTGIEKKGIPYSDLNSDQKKIFMELLDVYIGNYVFEFSETFRKKIIDAGLDNLSFAWAGVLDKSDGHYYSIHGPMLLIEFDNTQNNANHVHTVVRDLTNDFAEDLLREHYANNPH